MFRRGRQWLATLVAPALGAALLAAPLTAAPAAAASSRCAAYDQVVQETSPGGVLAGRTPLLVASYNIGGYNGAKSLPAWESRANKLVSMILRCSPDVIGLQEASQAWMQRQPFGSRNYAQYEHVVDLMNARTPGAPYRVTNTYRNVCPTTGRNVAVWNGQWQGQQASWRACTTSRTRSSSDNRTVYDSRVLTVVDSGTSHLPTASSNQTTLDWTVFSVNRTGRQFVFANTHLEARPKGKATGSKAANAFRRSQTARALATIQRVRVRQGARLPVVLAGDLNSTGRMRFRTPVDDLTRAGLVDLLGTDRRWHRSKSAKWRGSCTPVGVTRSLTRTSNPRVPLHVDRRIHAYYSTSNSEPGRGAGTGRNVCMYRERKPKKTRGKTAAAYYRYQGVQIDYLLASAPFLGRGWETVVDPNLSRAGHRSTPPSDHNMIAATLAF